MHVRMYAQVNGVILIVILLCQMFGNDDATEMMMTIMMKTMMPTTEATVTNATPVEITTMVWMIMPKGLVFY